MEAEEGQAFHSIRYTQLPHLVTVGIRLCHSTAARRDFAASRVSVDLARGTLEIHTCQESSTTA